MSTGVIPTRGNVLSKPSIPRPSGTTGALVIGGAHGSLGIVRSLGRRGVPVWVLTNDQLIARFSRYAGRCPKWPSDPETQASYLMDLGERHNLRDWTLFPGGDCEAEMLSQNRTRLKSMYRVTTPPWNVLRWAYDKRLSYRLAQDLGIAYPRTWYPAGRRELEALDCAFPAILKPAMKRKKNEFTLAKAWRVDSRSALLDRYDQACGMVDPGEVMVQELIPGHGSAQFSYGALWDGSGPVATLVARRSRQYPIDFGYTSTFVETVDCPEVEQIATCLLQAVRYRGLVEVEFKYDERDRRYKLLDINARAWTWVSLGERAGIDFPYLMLLAAEGRRLPVLKAKPGVSWAHMGRDVVAALQECRRGTLTLREYLRSLRGPVQFAVAAPDDPVPALMDVPLLLQRLWRRGRVG